MNNQETIKILKMHRYEMGLPNNQGSTWKPNADTIAIDFAISSLEAQKDDAWIPVTKRCPDNYSEVYISTQSGSSYHVFYSDNKYRFGSYCGDPICDAVTHWMPFHIPKPWTEVN
jgi:hypothetical protein